MDLRTGVKPNSRGPLLILAALLLIAAGLVHVFGDDSAPQETVAAVDEWQFACGPEGSGETELTAAEQSFVAAVEDEFPQTDFAVRSIALTQIVDDGNTRDSIPPVGVPQFVPIAQATGIGDMEPVLSVGINGDYRAYPLRILLWHEIVNDEIGGIPVLVSYCPLCNSGVVFDRRVRDEVLEFGNTGRIRFHDMVMYDKSTESWWQQATGEAVIGARTGTCMQPLPARLESVAQFRERAPDGRLLVPEDPDARPYGQSPFRDMDRLPRAVATEIFPYDVPSGVDPMDRVVVVDDRGWTMSLLREKKTLEQDGLVFNWTAGQNSIHDAMNISAGRDVGSVTVQRRAGDELIDVPYDVIFAFAFAAFYPDSKLNRLRDAEAASQ